MMEQLQTAAAGQEEFDKQLFMYGVASLPKPQNFAEDAKVVDFIISWLNPVIEQIRSRRQPLEQEWMRIQQMEYLIHNESQRYKGRSNAYLPVFLRTLNTRVSSLTRGIFPSDDYIDCAADGKSDSEEAKALKAYMQWELEHHGKLRTVIKPMLRQYDALGNGVLKFWYGMTPGRQGGRVKGKNSDVLFDTMLPSTPFDDGCRISARSMFNVYVYPETAETAAQASIVFEDLDVTRLYVKERCSSGRWKNAASAQAVSMGQVNTDWKRQQQMSDAAGMTSPVGQFSDNDLGGVTVMTEVYTYMVLPASAYAQGEDPSLPIPTLVRLIGDVPVEVKRNPYYHQHAPFVFARQEVKPGFFYGSGVGRAILWLQALANDFANQSNDVGNYTLNPIIKMNPGMMIGVPPPMAPGRVFKMTDIGNGMTFDRPPVELLQYGQNIAGMYVGMVQDFGGAPPVLQGVGAGKAAKTATGAQILQRNALSPLQDSVEDLENETLMPLMRGVWKNAVQYRNQDVMLQVMGQPLTVTPAMISCEAKFRWLASSQATNKQVMAQQAIGFLQAVMPLVPLLMQQGKTFDPTVLLRRIYNEGFGLRGFDEMIHDMDPAQKMQMQMAAMGGGAPGGGPQGGEVMGQGDGERIRSATEQAEGGAPGEAVEGEGGEFNEVRSMADELAALQGGGV